MRLGSVGTEESEIWEDLQSYRTVTVEKDRASWLENSRKNARQHWGPMWGWCTVPGFPSAFGHLPSIQNPARSHVINWLPGTIQKLAFCKLMWKDSWLSEKKIKSTVFFLCVFCIVGYKYTCNGFIEWTQFSAVQIGPQFSFQPQSSHILYCVCFSYHPSHDVSSRSCGHFQIEKQSHISS